MCHTPKLSSPCQTHLVVLFVMCARACVCVHVCVLYAMLCYAIQQYCCRNCCDCTPPAATRHFRNKSLHWRLQWHFLYGFGIFLWWENQCSYSSSPFPSFYFIRFDNIGHCWCGTHTHTASYTQSLLYRNCGFEFAIKKNLKQDRIMVVLMRLNKISICFVELEKKKKEKNAIIVTIATSCVVY